MSMLANPQASFDTIVTVGLTADNTSLQDKSVYENNDYVQKQFTAVDGTFDKSAFNKAYDVAKLYYNNLANANFEESMKRQTVFHRDNISALQDNQIKGPMYREVQIANPYEQVFSLTKLGRIDNPTQSVDELAQKHKVLANPTTAGENLENAVWENSPNNSFFSNFFDTLVIAQYDEDGEHIDPITGEVVKHSKGDLKLNQDGGFYYEKLDGRDIYGRRVLNKMNILTTDGSFWNKYDFFDSDDINQKSVGGTVMKNLALVGTMFIPYIGPWIIGLSIATQTAGFLSTLGKMALGSDNSTLSAIEGWSKSVNRQTAKTEYAQQNVWCWENFINLIGDVVGQLREARFIFDKVPAVIKGTNISKANKYKSKLEEFEKIYKAETSAKYADLAKKGLTNSQLAKASIELNKVAAKNAQAAMDSFVKGYNSIGEILFKGYMTGIVVQDTYGEAKQAGASDLDATLLTLGYAAGEYALLSTGLGKWILPELRVGGYKTQAMIKALTKLDKESTELKKQFGANLTKEAKQSYVKKVFNIGKGIANGTYVNGTKTLGASLAAGAGEGTEEVSEELLADFSKGCYDVVKWLQGEDIRLNSFGYNFNTDEWNSKDIIDRYGMSLIGGAIGGSIANTFTNYRGFKQLSDMTSQQAIQEIVYMARNGKLQDFVRQVNKSQISSSNLSATDFEIKNGQVYFAPGTENNNQDLYAKKAIIQQVQLIQSIIDANGASLSDESFLDKQTLSDLRFAALHNSVTAGSYLNEFNTLTSNLIKLESQLQTKQQSSLDSNQDSVVTDREKRKNELNEQDKQVVRDLETKIKEIKKQITDLVEGKRSYEFIADSLFEMTTALSGKFVSVTFPLYAENKYSKKFSELTDNEKAVTWKEYEVWKSTEGREKIHTISTIYRDIAQQASKVIQEQGKKHEKIPEEVRNLERIVSSIYDVIQGTNEAEWLQSAQDVQSASIINLNTRLIEQFGTETEKQELQTQLDALKTLNENSTEEEKKEAQKKFVLEQSRMVIDNLNNWLNPLFNSRVASTELKNQLNKVLDKLINIAEFNKFQTVENSEEIDPLLDPDFILWENKARELKSIKKEINLLQKTDFEKNLDEFSISIGKDPINISNLLARLNASFNDVSNNITRFNLDSQLYQDLENAITTIEMYEAAIMGARTDSADFSNYFGYNATLNEINSKTGNAQPELAEINSSTADALVVDINTNLNKLLFLKQLYQINQTQKLSKQDRISAKKDLLIYKSLKGFVQVPDDDPIKQWNGFAELQNIINGLTIHEKALRENSNNISDEDKIEFVQETLTVEDAIYDFFQKNKGKLSDPKKLVEFINSSRFQLYTEAKELLNEDLGALNNNSMLWWIASRAAVKSSDFYYQYKQIINPRSEHPLAPIPTQILAVQNIYSAIVNGDVFANFYEAFRASLLNDWKLKSLEERKEALKLMNRDIVLADSSLDDFAINFLPVPKYSNAVLVDGIAGSGKTTAVFEQVISLLKKFNSKLLDNVAIVHGANSNSAIKIRDNINLDDKTSKTYGRTEFMQEISSQWKEYEIDPVSGNYLVPKSDYNFTNENELRSALGINETATSPSLIFIDEISKFSTYDMDLINKFAKKYGITVVVAGDFDQSGVSGQHPITINGKNLVWQFNLNRTDFVNTPKLGVSMRTDNSVKTRNQQKMQAYIQNPTDEILDFEYFENENQLYGDKVILYDAQSVQQDSLNSGKNIILNEVIESVDKMVSTLKKGEKIQYIYTDPTSPIYTLLSTKYANFVDFKEGGSAHGLEGQYYIIEASPNQYMVDSVTSKSAIDQYNKDIYTGLTRAEQGSIIIAPTNIGPKLDSHQIHEMFDESINSAVIASYSNRYLQQLEQTVPNGNKVTYIPRTTSTITTIKVKPDVKNGLDDGVDNTSPNLPVLGENHIVVSNPPVKNIPSHTYENIILENDPIEKDLIALQNEAIKNPVTDNGFDVTDEKTDLKYGQIVRIGDPNKKDYGVIFGVKYHENGDYEYLIKRVGKSNLEKISSNNITGVVNTNQAKNQKIFSHDDMVNTYGHIANIDSITISYNGQYIQLPLCQIPFIDKNGSGTNNIINYYHRNIVVVNINDVHVPFYMSTGLGGKENVQSGLWYPFFGIADGWINKGTQDQINQFYGSPILQVIAEQLNATLGTGYVDDIKGPITLDPSYKGEYPQLDFINQDMNPTANKKADTKEKFEANVKDVLTRIETAIDSLTPNQSTFLPESTTNGTEIQPITNTDIIEEAKYKDQIDTSNEEGELPQSSASSQGINMLLHSFNTFELGVFINTDGKPIRNEAEQNTEVRIDSVNGLMNIDNLKNNPIKSVNEYIKVLGRLRSILFNTADKTDLENQLKEVLGLDNINVIFALKSIPRPSDTNRANGIEFVETKSSPFNKGISEKTLFNGSTDIRSNEWHTKTIVTIVNTNGKNVLELPLLALSSPFTLMQITDENGAYVFDSVLQRFNVLQNDGISYQEAQNIINSQNGYSQQFKKRLQDIPNTGKQIPLDLHEISEILGEEFVKSYHSLANLFKLYSFTDRAIQYIDPSWTIAKNLELLGPQFVVNKGDYQLGPDFTYNANSTLESEWQDVASLQDNPQVTVSDVFVSIDGNAVDSNGNTYTNVVKKGHSFVLVSFDRKLVNSQRIADYYLKQISDPTTLKKVKLMYILPPKASIDEYIENLNNLFNKTGTVKSIGQLFTAYKLTKILMQDKTFRNRLDAKLRQGASQKVQKLIEEIDSHQGDIAAQKSLLYQADNWSDVGFPGKPIENADLFKGVLMSVIYDKNSLLGNTAFTLNTQDLDLVKSILNTNGIDGVYYNSRIYKDDTKINSFHSLGNNYQINGKSYKIHGKLDSYMFRGDVSNIVEDFIKNLKPSANGKHRATADTYSYLRHEGRAINMEQQRKNSVINYVKDKTGIDITNFYQGTIQDGNQQVVDYINADVAEHVAFIVNGEIKISNKHEALGQSVVITDLWGNPLTDISTVVDNNGRHNFILSSNDIRYNATFKDGQLSLESVLDQEQTQITEDEAFKIKDEINKKFTEDIKSTKHIRELATYENYNEFIEFFENSVPLKSELKRLKRDKNDELPDIIKTLIDKKLNETNVCPININIVC